MSHKCPLIGNRRCPEKSDKDGGCPAWVTGVVESEAFTGQQRAISDCVLRLIPRWLLQGYANTDGVRASLSSMRGAIAKAVEMGVEKAIESGQEIPPRLLGNGDGREVLVAGEFTGNDQKD